MKIYSPFFLIIISATLWSCKKEVSELPAATQSGANTFGCKVDGKFWVPAGFGIISTTPTLEARLYGTELRINARNFSSSPLETEFDIFVANVTGNGNYLLNTTTTYPSSSGSNYGYYVRRRFTPENEWITSSTYTGMVTITKIDTVSHFVSGTFEFQAVSIYDASQILSVTEGRFDVRTQ